MLPPNVRHRVSQWRCAARGFASSPSMARLPPPPVHPSMRGYDGRKAPALRRLPPKPAPPPSAVPSQSASKPGVQSAPASRTQGRISPRSLLSSQKVNKPGGRLIQMPVAPGLRNNPAARDENRKPELVQVQGPTSRAPRVVVDPPKRVSKPKPTVSDDKYYARILMRKEQLKAEDAARVKAPKPTVPQSTRNHIRQRQAFKAAQERRKRLKEYHLLKAIYDSPLRRGDRVARKRQGRVDALRWTNDEKYENRIAWVWKDIVGGKADYFDIIDCPNLPPAEHEVAMSATYEVLCSYNMRIQGVSELHLRVPGCPPIYHEGERSWPRTLEPDSKRDAQIYHRAVYDENSAINVFEPMFLAARVIDRWGASKTSFDDVDVVISRGLIMSLLRRLQGEDAHMTRINIEMVHNTLFVSRPPQQGVIDREGKAFGHSFEKHVTRLPTALEDTEGCIRYVRYRFGNTTFVVQMEVDAAYGVSLNEMPLSKYTINSTESKPGILVETDYTNLGKSNKLHSMTAEIKTGHLYFDFDLDKILSQMWFGRTPHLITARHQNGSFMRPEHNRIGELLSAWEHKNQEVLRKFVTLVERLKRAATENGRMCGVVCDSGSNEFLVYDTDGGNKPLSEDVVKYFWSGDWKPPQETAFGPLRFQRTSTYARSGGKMSRSRDSELLITPSEFKQMLSAAHEDERAASETGRGPVWSQRGKSTPRGEEKPITREEAKQMLHQAGRDMSKIRKMYPFAKTGERKSLGGDEWGNPGHLERIREAPKWEILQEEPVSKHESLPAVETPAIPDHGAWGQTFVQKFEEDRSALREQDPRRHAAKPLKFNRPRNPVTNTSPTGWGPDSGIIPPVGRKDEGSQ